MRYHQSAKSQNDARTSSLINVKDKYDYSEITYPTSLEDIKYLRKIIKYVFLYMKLLIKKMRKLMK